jgi:hypothetical protein
MIVAAAGAPLFVEEAKHARNCCRCRPDAAEEMGCQRLGCISCKAATATVAVFFTVCHIVLHGVLYHPGMTLRQNGFVKNLLLRAVIHTKSGQNKVTLQIAVGARRQTKTYIPRRSHSLQ